jgi:hypothetical protein
LDHPDAAIGHSSTLAKMRGVTLGQVLEQPSNDPNNPVKIYKEWSELTTSQRKAILTSCGADDDLINKLAAYDTMPNSDQVKLQNERLMFKKVETNRLIDLETGKIASVFTFGSDENADQSKNATTSDTETQQQKLKEYTVKRAQKPEPTPGASSGSSNEAIGSQPFDIYENGEYIRSCTLNDPRGEQCVSYTNKDELHNNRIVSTPGGFISLTLHGNGEVEIQNVFHFDPKQGIYMMTVNENEGITRANIEQDKMRAAGAAPPIGKNVVGKIRDDFQDIIDGKTTNNLDSGKWYKQKP